MAGNYEDKLVPLAGFVDGMARVSTELEKCRGVEWSIEMHNRDANAHPDLVDTLGAIYQTMLDDTAAMVERIKALEQLEERVQALEQSGGCGCGGGDTGEGDGPNPDSPSAVESMDMGKPIVLYEDGAPVKFIVACQDYEPDLNGTGKTLVIRADPLEEKIKWNASNMNNVSAVANAIKYLNETYIGRFDEATRTAIGTTKIRATPGNGSNAVGTAEFAIFPPSMTEMGAVASNINVEGTSLGGVADYIKSRLAGKGGTAEAYSRTPVTTANTSMWTFSPTGQYVAGASKECWIFPMFALAPGTQAAPYPKPTAVKALKDMAEGDYVLLNENGVETRFVVGQHNYEPDRNGQGRTLLIRSLPYDTLRAFDDGNSNDVEASTLFSWLNGECKAGFDQAIQAAMGETKFLITAGGSLKTIQRAVFTPSLIEMYQNYSGVSNNQEGSPLAICTTAADTWFNTLLKSYASGTQLITRSPSVKGANQILARKSNGAKNYPSNVAINANVTGRVLSCCTLPDTIGVAGDGTIVV